MSDKVIWQSFDYLTQHTHTLTRTQYILAASESVSKLFRQSSGPKSTSTTAKSASATDKSDATSAASLTLSLSSLASSSATGAQERQPSIPETPTPVEGSGSASASYTASTALLMDAPAATAAEPAESEPQLRRTPNGKLTLLSCLRRCRCSLISSFIPAANPFLAENSPLKQTILGHALISVKIGSILEQSLVYYTSRLLAARFLLSGQAAGLQPDNVSRVSIKSLSLAVIAQCVRLAPRVLQLPLEISELELELLCEAKSFGKTSADSTQASSPQSSNDSQLSAELGQSMTGSLLQPDDGDNLLLLDIKDDHFGPSTCPVYLQQSPTLSRSADTVLLQKQLEARQQLSAQKAHAADANLSRSEIIGSSYRITIATEDAPPLSLPPRPPKRTKSVRNRSGSTPAAATPSAHCASGGQVMSDVLLFYGHCDPILRGGVQQIVGNFVQASGAGRCLQLQRGLDLPHLLAILLKVG